MARTKILYGLIISAIFCGSMVGIILMTEFNTINSGKNRIISIAAACTEILYAIEAGDKVVGVDQYSINYALAGDAAFQGAPGGLGEYPNEIPNKTNVGTTSALNLELVVSLNPSLVFSWDWATSANTAIENLGIDVFKINPQSIIDVLDLTTTIGDLVGEPSEAAAVNQEIQERINNITSALENITEGEEPLVYYELASLGKTVGPGTITDEMIAVAGGINLAGNESLRYPTLSSEYIVARNPDIIIIVSYGVSIDEVKNRAGWDNITAVKNDEVYKIESGWVTASPRLILGLEQFSDWFHPSVF
ncbi:MAG TPA: ABC transporter substrate-binding protein [Candidatus Deferrimicrobium sp.]|nr:ABC transporter substrate-binding protein [Candidatus Deferrimicrobium sp.]